MASITIPEACIPQWANAISEEQWKEQLLIRIKQMQDKDSQSWSCKISWVGYNKELKSLLSAAHNEQYIWNYLKYDLL